jgi:uncharacterized membrane protein YccC
LGDERERFLDARASSWGGHAAMVVMIALLLVPAALLMNRERYSVTVGIQALTLIAIAGIATYVAVWATLVLVFFGREDRNARG